MAAVHGFIRDALMNRVRPVLSTSTAAHLGWFVASELQFSGGYWAAREEDGAVYNGRFRYRTDALEDLWGEFSRDREQLRSFRGLALSAQEAFFFDVFTRGRVQEKTLYGAVIGHVVAGLGGDRLARWGEYEPLANVWSRTELTDPLRAQMSASRRRLARGECGEPVSIQVSRTRIELLEHTRGLVPAGEYGRPDGFAEGMPLAIHPAITETLKGLVDGFHPDLTVISYGEVIDQDGSLGQIASRRRMDVPLAVLIEVPAVWDLGTGAADLSVNRDVISLDPKRIPSLLIRFSGGDELWHQLVALAHDLNQGRLAAVLAIEFNGVKLREETRG